MKLATPLIFAIVLFHSMHLQAQFGFHILGGAANYQGDIAKDITNLSETHLAFGGGLDYSFSRFFSLKGQLLLTEISGDDWHYEERHSRLFRFDSRILELAAIGEWSFFGRGYISNTGVFVPRLSPGMYVGLGLAKIDNNAECYHQDCIDGTKLYPFPEEDLKTAFLAIPLGLTLNYDISPSFYAGVRGGYRYVFSDYLDGISQSANSGKNDWYFILGLTVGIKLSNTTQ